MGVNDVDSEKGAGLREDRRSLAFRRVAGKLLNRRGHRHGLQIVHGPNESREFILTNKMKAYFAGETGHARERSYRGLTVELHKFLEGWELSLGDRPVQAWGLRNACVLPQSMTCEFVAERMTETVFLADTENLLIITFSSTHSGKCSFSPRVDIRSIWEDMRPEYDVRWDPTESVLAVRRLDHKERTPEEDWPVWLAIACDRPSEFAPEAAYRETSYGRDSARRAMASAVPFVPGRIQFDCGGPDAHTSSVTFAAAVGDTLDEARELALKGVRDEFGFYDVKMRRIAELLDRVAVSSNDSDYDHALQWAAASLDALMMNQMGLGIFAGLHWFPNYWGRDTFISLPGACLVLGQLAEAREILETFAGMQCEDDTDRSFGRIPNLAMPGEVHYNTADGTWWFIREAYEYLLYSGDRKFAKRILPVVKHAIEGALSRRVDEHGLCMHGDAETWMDACGDSGPFSPRGDRAVDIQALWFAALESGARIAEITGDQNLAVRWREIAEKVKASFGQLFWDDETDALYDHINADGTPDRRPRPNQVFALTVPWAERDPRGSTAAAERCGDESAAHDGTSLLSRDRQRSVLDALRRTCVLPHGVVSLAPTDPDFHPRHVDLDRYHFDEAYHNGDVWVWLTGPVVSALVAQGRISEAWAQTRVLRDMIFDEGAAGTLSELRNGVHPESGENVAGAVSQAWSLAEFLRNFYQDYLGIHPDLLAGTITIRPALPSGLPWVSAPVQVGKGTMQVFFKVNENGSRGVYRVAADAGLPRLTVRFVAMVPPGADVQHEAKPVNAVLMPGSTVEFVVERVGENWRTIVRSGDELLGGEPVGDESAGGEPVGDESAGDRPSGDKRGGSR